MNMPTAFCSFLGSFTEMRMYSPAGLLPISWHELPKDRQTGNGLFSKGWATTQLNLKMSMWMLVGLK